MLDIIKFMIERAEKTKDYELIRDVKRIIDTLATTFNAPSNWRDIGEELEKATDKDSWVYEQLELWNHVDE